MVTYLGCTNSLDPFILHGIHSIGLNEWVTHATSLAWLGSMMVIWAMQDSGTCVYMWDGWEGAHYVPPNPAEIVDEYLNHENRKHNLVIYGIPENTATTAPELQQADSNSFNEFVDSNK